MDFVALTPHIYSSHSYTNCSVLLFAHIGGEEKESIKARFSICYSQFNFERFCGTHATSVGFYDICCCCCCCFWICLYVVIPFNRDSYALALCMSLNEYVQIHLLMFGWVVLFSTICNG